MLPVEVAVILQYYCESTATYCEPAYTYIRSIIDTCITDNINNRQVKTSECCTLVVKH